MKGIPKKDSFDYTWCPFIMYINKICEIFHLQPLKLAYGGTILNNELCLIILLFSLSCICILQKLTERATGLIIAFILSLHSIKMTIKIYWEGNN